MMLIFIALIYSLVIEIPRYIKRKAWKETILYALLWLLAMATGVYMSLALKRPFVGEIILNFVEKAFPFVNSF